MTCQLYHVLAPHRRGGAIGYPGHLGACDSGFPPTKQHCACRAEGAVHHPDIIDGYLTHATCKMYATLVLGLCIVALLCYPLPGESVQYVFVAHAIGGLKWPQSSILESAPLLLASAYTIASYRSYSSRPRASSRSPSVPLNRQYPVCAAHPRADSDNLTSTIHRYKFTPEILWGCMHGFLGLGFVAWWRGTIAYTQMVKMTE
jgi:hypothetical protein